MAKLAFLWIVFAGIAANSASAMNGGMRLTINQKAIDYALETWVPIGEEFIRNYDIPDQNGMGCGAGQDKSGQLCYPKCRSGYYGVGPVCWQSCGGFGRDDGAFCAKPAPYGRGAGNVPSCRDDEDKNGALCYPKCRSGYYGVGPVCWKGCAGFGRDDGAFCAKPGPYGRGAGRSPCTGCSGCTGCGWGGCSGCSGCSSCSTSHCRDSEQVNGLLCYPKCRAGFHNVGCCICSPNCPSGFTDIGVSCAKPSYGRSAGRIPSSCGAGKELNGALCYPKCREGFHNVGCCICSPTCPSYLSTDIGVSCTKKSYGRGAGDWIGYKATNIQLKTFELDSYVIDWRDASIFVNISGINIHAGLDFAYKNRAFPHIPSGAGHVELTMGGSSELTVEVTPSIKNGRPQVALSANMDLGDFNLDISGTGADSLYNWIIGLADGKIKDAAVDGIETAIRKAGEDLNLDLDNISTTFPLPLPAPYDIAEIDYTFTDMEMMPGFGSFAIRGTVNSTVPSAQQYGGETTSLPAIDAEMVKDSMISLDISPTLFNSAGFVYDAADLISFTIGPKMIPASSPIQLTTDVFVAIAPGFSAWPGHKLNLTISTRGGPKVAFRKEPTDHTGVDVYMPVEFDFDVIFPNGTELTAFGVHCPMRLGANVSVDVHQMIKLQLDHNATCMPMETSYTNVGPIDDDAFEELINLAVAIGVPLADNMLKEKGFPIPQLSETVQIEDPVIIQHDGVMTVGTNIRFGTRHPTPVPTETPTTPPTTSEPTTKQPTTREPTTAKPTLEPTVPTEEPTIEEDGGENGLTGPVATSSPTSPEVVSSTSIIIGSAIGAVALLAGVYSAFTMKRAPSHKPFRDNSCDEEGIDERTKVDINTMMTANPIYGTSRPQPLPRYPSGKDDAVLPLGHFQPPLKSKKQFAEGY